MGQERWTTKKPMKQKIEGGWEAGKLIDWEEVEREFDERFPRHGFDNNAENEFHSQLIKSFLHSKLLAQQAKTEKLVLERMIEILDEKFTDNGYVGWSDGDISIPYPLEVIKKELLSEMEIINPKSKMTSTPRAMLTPEKLVKSKKKLSTKLSSKKCQQCRKPIPEDYWYCDSCANHPSVGGIMDFTVKTKKVVK